MLRSIFLTVALLALSAPATSAPSLHNVVQSGDAATLHKVIAAGANVDQRDSVGRTPLMLAASRGNSEIVQILLVAGADAAVRDNNGITTVMLGADSGNLPMVQSLIAAGANAQTRNSNGQDAREYITHNVAMGQGSAELQRMLNYLDEQAAFNRRYPPRAAPAAGRSLTAVNGPEELLDISQEPLTHEQLQQAAAAALLKRGWSVIVTEPDRVVGSHSKHDIEHRVEIRVQPPSVRIAYLRGYEHIKTSWLKNLKQDMVVTMSRARFAQPAAR